MQCLSIALLYLPCCEKDLLRQERRPAVSLGGVLFTFLIIRVFCKIRMCWAVTFDFCFVVADGARPSKNWKGGSGTSAGVEVYTAEC